MPLYSILLAHDASVYGTVEVEADDLAAAVEQIRADLGGKGTYWGDVTEIDWTTSANFRIVTVQLDDPTTPTDHLADGIYVSEEDESTPRSAEDVLAEVTKHRITK